MAGAPEKKYLQRRPEKTVLYRVIQQHLESFLEHASESSGKRLPTCQLLLPFSCKRRGRKRRRRLAVDAVPARQLGRG
jgi:hypothetical protein